MNTPPFMAPGPFARITAIHFPGALFQLRLLRDDGYLYIPGGPSLRIKLSIPGGAEIFTGYTDDLDYLEAENGLVNVFEFLDGYFRLELNRTILKNKYGLIGADVGFILTTDGEDTLTCQYPRIYAGVGSAVAITVGRREVRIPFWQVSTTTVYPTATSTAKTTTVRSSVPYGVIYGIENGNALGRFQLPTLGVEWLPTEDLSTWYRLFHVNGVCSQGTINIPSQSVAGMGPPAQSPTGPGDRIYTVSFNVNLAVALSACPNAWSATAITVSSDFGYSDTIPYNNAAEACFAVNYPLADQTPNLAGRSFQRTYSFQWDVSSFPYDTGEWPQLYLDQTAVRVQSPAIDFDRFSVTPLPE